MRYLLGLALLVSAAAQSAPVANLSLACPNESAIGQAFEVCRGYAYQVPTNRQIVATGSFGSAFWRRASDLSGADTVLVCTIPVEPGYYSSCRDAAGVRRMAFVRKDSVSTPVIQRFELKMSSTDATSVKLQWQPQNGASEYAVSRDGRVVGSTVAVVGYFTDFDLRPEMSYQYTVTAHDAHGAVIAESVPASAMTKKSSAIRTHYTVLAIAFNPEQTSLITEETYLKHRIQFLKLASLGSAVIGLYKGGIVSSAVTPAVEPGTTRVDYAKLVTRRDLPELDGYSMVDLIEKGDIVTVSP